MSSSRTSARSEFLLCSTSLTFSVLFIFIISLSSPVTAIPRNVTIDDQGGDPDTGELPLYRPGSAWANEKCESCAIHPDIGRLHNATATAATFVPDRNVTNNALDFSFTGTAIYIFFALFENEGPGVTVKTECNFVIDGEHVGYFNHSGDSSRKIGKGRQYQVPVFSRSGLKQERHSMTIYMADVDYNTFLSFDYAIYTTERGTGTGTLNLRADSSTPSSASTTSSHSSKVSGGIIAGGVIGGVAILAGFIALIYFYRRDNRRFRVPSSPGSHVPRPFPMDTPLGTELGPRGPSSPRSNATRPTITSILKYKSASSGSSGSGTRSGSGSGSDGTVERRIRAANQRMRSLRAEIASVSGHTASSSNSRNSRRANSRAMADLAEEVRRLRQELQALKQLQRQQTQARQLQPTFEEPPPTYFDDSNRS
ncbi:hypothetical protein D9756_001283 [Leucocoprinus leucothites]|uniref:Uncharacterized protein n=1 Tax=Leucocoprinus leucothites TaxID=201217 RepID=A0A8H5G448_9AGAR|nr:hypothetical protein D9756_001283 [Leucoagaricus leucothites]